MNVSPLNYLFSCQPTDISGVLVLFWAQCCNSVLTHSSQWSVCTRGHRDCTCSFLQVLPSYVTKPSSVYILTGSVPQFPLPCMKLWDNLNFANVVGEKNKSYLVLLCFFLLLTNEINLLSFFFLQLNSLTIHFTHLKFISHLVLVYLELCNYTAI